MPSMRGPTAVTVEIRDGGIAFVRITDNGCGIAPKRIRSRWLSCAIPPARSSRRRICLPCHLPGLSRRGAFQHCGRLPGGAHHQDSRENSHGCPLPVIEGGRREDTASRKKSARRTAPPLRSGETLSVQRAGPDGSS